MDTAMLIGSRFEAGTETPEQVLNPRTGDLVEAIPDPGEVRQDHIDAGLVLLREQDSAVDDEQPAGMLEDGHVAPDLTEPAQWDDPKAVPGQWRRRAELGVRMAHVVSPLVGDAERWSSAVVGDERLEHQVGVVALDELQPPSVREQSEECAVAAGQHLDGGQRVECGGVLWSGASGK